MVDQPTNPGTEFQSKETTARITALINSFEKVALVSQDQVQAGLDAITEFRKLQKTIFNTFICLILYSFISTGVFTYFWIKRDETNFHGVNSLLLSNQEQMLNQLGLCINSTNDGAKSSVNTFKFELEQAVGRSIANQDRILKECQRLSK